MVSFFAAIFFVRHPSCAKRDSDGAGLAIGVSMCDSGGCFGFGDYTRDIIGEIGADGSSAHGAAVAAGTLAIEDAGCGNLPRCAFADCAKNAVSGTAVTAPWVAGVFASECRGERFLFDMAVTL